MRREGAGFENGGSCKGVELAWAELMINWVNPTNCVIYQIEYVSLRLIVLECLIGKPSDYRV